MSRLVLVLFALAQFARADVTCHPQMRLAGSIADNDLIRTLAGAPRTRMVIKEGKLASLERESKFVFDPKAKTLTFVRDDAQTWKLVDRAELPQVNLKTMGTIRGLPVRFQSATPVTKSPVAEKIGEFETEKHSMRVMLGPEDAHSAGVQGMESTLTLTVWTTKTTPAAQEVRPLNQVMQALLLRPMLSVVTAMTEAEAAAQFEPMTRLEGTPVRVALTMSIRYVGQGQARDLGPVLQMITDNLSFSTTPVDAKLLEIPPDYRRAPFEIAPPPPQN
jgi:hypothetical protein